MLRVGVVLGVVAALATGAALAAPGPRSNDASAARARTAAAPFAEVRVGTNRIPFRGTRCKSDQRRSGLVFREIDCSVRVTVKKRSPFTASIFYRGQIQYIAHSILKAGKHNELVGVRVTPSMMPGGPYSCAFRLGPAATELNFATDGPQGRLRGATVCATPRGKNAFCRSDASKGSLAAPRSLMCGGVFVGFAGKTWAVKLVRLTKAGAAIVGRYGGRRFSGPISERWVAFKAHTVTGAYRAAKYSCLFFADRKQLGAHEFNVSG